METSGNTEEFQNYKPLSGVAANASAWTHVLSVETNFPVVACGNSVSHKQEESEI